ncbi:unnamed protein product, partial [Pylaiella littoralis]
GSGAEVCEVQGVLACDCQPKDQKLPLSWLVDDAERGACSLDPSLTRDRSIMLSVIVLGAVGDDGSYHRQDSVRPRDHGRITRPGVGVLRSTSVEGGCLHRHLQRQVNGVRIVAVCGGACRVTMFRALLFPLKFPGTRVHSFSIQGWLLRSPEIPANALSPGAARDGDFFF